MGILLDPSKNFITIQLQYIEDENERNGTSRFYFINNRKEAASWVAKGYLTSDAFEQAKLASSDKPTPGMPAKPPPDPKKIVQILRTWWSRMSWREQNNLYARCLKQSTSPDGKARTDLDAISYRDMKLKTCLKKWDLKDDSGNEVTITETVIDNLVPEVAQELLNQFELLTEAGEEDLKN